MATRMNETNRNMGGYLDELKRRNEKRKPYAQQKTREMARQSRALKRLENDMPKRYTDFVERAKQKKEWDMQSAVMNERQREDYNQPKGRYDNSAVRNTNQQARETNDRNVAVKYARQMLNRGKGPQVWGVKMEDNLNKAGSSYKALKSRMDEEDRKRKLQNGPAINKALSERYRK